MLRRLFQMFMADSHFYYCDGVSLFEAGKNNLAKFHGMVTKNVEFWDFALKLNGAPTLLLQGYL